MKDVPYQVLLDPANRYRFSDRLALPEVRGLYAWWPAGGTSADGIESGGAAPVYIGVSDHVANDVRADAIGAGTSEFRKKLAIVLPSILKIRPMAGARRPALSDEETSLMNVWISERLALSWCELAHARQYQRALSAAFDPVLNRRHMDAEDFLAQIPICRPA